MPPLWDGPGSCGCRPVSASPGRVDCKPNCKPTPQHTRARGVTNQDDRVGNAEPEHTLSHVTAQASMRNLRTRKPLCGYPHRGFESHPLRHLRPEICEKLPVFRIDPRLKPVKGRALDLFARKKAGHGGVDSRGGTTPHGKITFAATPGSSRHTSRLGGGYRQSSRRIGHRPVTHGPARARGVRRARATTRRADDLQVGSRRHAEPH